MPAGSLSLAGEFKASSLAPEKSHLVQDAASFTEYTLCSPIHFSSRMASAGIESFCSLTGIFQSTWTGLGLVLTVGFVAGFGVVGGGVLKAGLTEAGTMHRVSLDADL